MQYILIGNFQYFFLFIRLFKGYKEEEDYDYYDNYTADVEIDSIVQVCCVNLDGTFNIFRSFLHRKIPIWIKVKVKSLESAMEW